MLKFDREKNLVIQSISFIPPAIIPAPEVKEIYLALKQGKEYPACTPKYRLTKEHVDFIKQNYEN